MVLRTLVTVVRTGTFIGWVRGPVVSTFQREKSCGEVDGWIA